MSSNQATDNCVMHVTQMCTLTQTLDLTRTATLPSIKRRDKAILCADEELCRLVRQPCQRLYVCAGRPAWSLPIRRPHVRL